MHFILNQFFSTLTLDYGCRPMNDIDKIQGFRHIFSLLFLRPFTHIKKTQSFVLVSKRERAKKNIQNFFFLLVFFDRLEITSRMAPQAIFRAWRPIFNEGEEGERNSLPHPAAPLAEYYSYDEQNVTVNLEDRTLVSIHTGIIIKGKIVQNIFSAKSIFTKFFCENDFTEIFIFYSGFQLNVVCTHIHTYYAKYLHII